MTTARNDRILFWPPFLAIVLFIEFNRVSAEPEIFNLDAGLILLFWLIAAGAGVIACIAAIMERAWLRLLSAMILPLSILVWAFARGPGH